MGDHSLRHHYVVVIVVDTVNLIVPKMVNAASSMANKLIELWSLYGHFISPTPGEMMKMLGVLDLFILVISSAKPHIITLL